MDETCPFRRLYVIQYTDIFNTTTILLGTNGVVVSIMHCIYFKVLLCSSYFLRQWTTIDLQSQTRASVPRKRV